MQESGSHHAARVRQAIACAVLAAIALAGAHSLAAQQLGVTVPAQDLRNTQILSTHSQMQLPSFTSLTAWQARRAFLRNQVLVAAGLSPLPPKTPLHAQVFGKYEGKGYTVEKVLLETFPGFYLGGNLYRPTGDTGKHPGILNPHGHWQYGRLENESVDSGPALGISLARQGYVVFAYDMVGYTDTVQVPHRFGSPAMSLWSFGPFGLQLWDSIRALDFVTSLPDVDPARIGMTGASGGATQTFTLTAVDNRVQFASPVNMVSSIMQGGDLCENAPGLRIDTSNVEIAATFGPRPMLLVSDTTDWTRNMPRVEYPAIKRLYDLFGKGDALSMVQYKAVHNFNQDSREAVYRFFAQVNPGLSNPRDLKEHNIDVPMLQDMLVLSNRALPSNALDLDGLFRAWRSMADAENQQPQSDEFLRNRLRQTLAVENPTGIAAEQHGDSIVLSRPAAHDRVPGVFLPGKGEMAIVVDADGSAAALKTPLVTQLRKEHHALLVLDVFQTGEAIAARGTIEPLPASAPASMTDAELEQRNNLGADDPLFVPYNVTDDQGRVQDILTAIAWARKHSTGPIGVYAHGDAALWATFAAAVSNTPVTLHLEDVPLMLTGADYLTHFDVPGILRAGGLPVAERLAAQHN